MEKFDRYFSLAKKYEASAKIDLAKRNYYLAAKQLLLASKLSTPELKQTRQDKANRLIEYADNLEVTKQNVRPSTEGKFNTFKSVSSTDSDEKMWHSVEIPNVSFDDVIGLEDAKEEIKIAMIYPVIHPDKYKLYRKESGGGVLLYGPPGTGKTMLARAAAHEVKAKFYLVRSSDIVSKWVGESEKNIASLFETARKDDRAIIFIDEMDTLFAGRGQDIHNDRRVNEFLQQIDGFVGKNPNLLILGSTNKPWDIDSAAMRSGRFSSKIYIPLPNFNDRVEILKKYLADLPLDSNVDINELAKETESFSGADLFSLCDRAKQRALVESFTTNNVVNIERKDFFNEIAFIKRNINTVDIARFEKYAGLNIGMNETKTVDLNNDQQEEIIVKDSNLMLNPNNKYSVEFYLSGEHQSIYIEVNNQKVATTKNIKNYTSNEFILEKSGKYLVKVFDNKLVGTFSINVQAPIEDNDLGI